MWQKFKKWVHENQTNIVSLVCASLIAGLFIAALCLHPPILIALSGLAIFGITPLAFLAGLPLPLALLSVSAVVSGFTLSVVAVIIAIDHELMNVFHHLTKLLNSNPQQRGEVIENALYKSWLTKSAFSPIDDDFDDMSEDVYDDELSSSSDDLESGSLEQPASVGQIVHNNVAMTTPHPPFRHLLPISGDKGDREGSFLGAP